MEDRKFLGQEKIGSLLFKLALPTVVAQLVNMLYNIVDRIYIGHIEGTGALALTGVGVCLPLILIVSAFAALISSGGGPRASIMMGHNDYDRAERILGNEDQLPSFCMNGPFQHFDQLCVINIFDGDPCIHDCNQNSPFLPLCRMITEFSCRFQNKGAC